MKNIIYSLFLLACWGCTHYSENAKVQNKRDHIINVKELVKEIEIEDVLINNVSWPYLLDKYLIISDFRSTNEVVHIFDKNNYNYINSIANRGQGPGEITTIGHLEWDKKNRLLYVTDHGKQRIFSYDLDSIQQGNSYLPKTKKKLNANQFPDKYCYINDTLAIGVMIHPLGNSDFKPVIGKWNMNTGKMTDMKYEHPDINKKRIVFDVSIENGMYVECYCNHDLMTICDLDGNLKYNIYGKGWDNLKADKNSYYGDVAFCNNKIFALFSGENRFSKDNGMRSIFPTKFLIFDLNGNYLQTLETGYRIAKFCYDSENNRIIMSFDDEIQFGYLDLDELTI